MNRGASETEKGEEEKGGPSTENSRGGEGAWERRVSSREREIESEERESGTQRELEERGESSKRSGGTAAATAGSGAQLPPLFHHIRAVPPSSASVDATAFTSPVRASSVACAAPPPRFPSLLLPSSLLDASRSEPVVMPLSPCNHPKFRLTSAQICCAEAQPRGIACLRIVTTAI